VADNELSEVALAGEQVEGFWRRFERQDAVDGRS
jgi:hypothetical protein